MFKLPDGSLRLIVQGLARLTLGEIVSTHPYLRARVTAANEDTNDRDVIEIDALARNIKTNFQQVVSLSPLLSDDLQTLAMNISEPGRLADFIASSLTTISTAVKQEVLETLDIRARMDNLNRILIKELEVLELGSKIQSQVQSEVGKNQREYFLREQMKAIQKELGEGDDQTKEVEELAEKIEAAGMPEAVKKEALRELDRLSKMPVAAAEYTVSRTYLDWLVALPWSAADRRGHRSAENQERARRGSLRSRKSEGSHHRVPGGPQAESDGEGTDSLLRRTSWRRQDVAGAVDCRIARPQVRPCFTGRHARRGRNPRASPHLHRRACPARSFRGCAGPNRRTRCSSSTRSTSSAPTSAAIRHRRCSKCSIRSRTTRSAIITSTCRSICRKCCSSRRPTSSIRFPRRCGTAWKCSRSPATPRKRSCRSRIDHLVEKQVKNHGLTPEYIQFSPDALRQVIRGYTREAGVRNLEREIGALCRKAARRRAEGDETPIAVTPDVVIADARGAALPR